MTDRPSPEPRPTAHTFEQVRWDNIENETRIGVLQEMVNILLNELDAAPRNRLTRERLEIIEAVRQFVIGDPQGGGAERTLAFLDGIEFVETGVDRRSARTSSSVPPAAPLDVERLVDLIEKESRTRPHYGRTPRESAEWIAVRLRAAPLLHDPAAPALQATGCPCPDHVGPEDAHPLAALQATGEPPHE